MTDTAAHTRLLFAPGDLRGAEAIDDVALVSALGDVESAWVNAQAHAGLISAHARTEAVTGIEATSRSLLADTSELEALAAGSEPGGNPVIPFLQAVRSRLGHDASRALHKGLTSQDVMDSALGLLMSRVARQTHARLDVIAELLVDLSDAHASTICLARTLTQPALPTTFGLKVAAWAAEVQEVQSLTPRIDYVQVGGAAGTRAAIREFAGAATETLLREFHVQLRGPDAALASIPVPWHTDRVRVLNWASHLTQCVTVGASIARDVLIGTRPEVGEMALASTGGSSAMPQKLNPTLAVLLHRNGMRVPGLMATLTSTAAEAIEERSDGAWHAEWPALSELMGLAVSSLSMLQRMIEGLSVNPEAMRNNVNAASPGIFAERLSISFGERLTKAEIQEVIADGGDPAAALKTALDQHPVSQEGTDGQGSTADIDLDGFFSPENYLGDAEDIRLAIIATINGPEPVSPGLLPNTARK
ncbi:MULTISPECIES: lyase family protein [Brevibacterium]|uniref:3-carboxy-cis,cis-muconate cycloisomerase n=1 Tax=Brevibacterium antiquum CNRZ 918 TaxID=1255637 RepID=A0A2H1IUI9_9MICO|nr:MULTISPECIES: lyase family protein [Brevibacterium]SMX78790.1 3-carboxy-cis,cis-muconate cycloisomerase [Brevibacterium antiquum CNRZ 918]HCG56186.1 3-carboxy-cis,cis-muconate cycloisomerase [Brevibacterium sp.]